jgi:putative addiction module killer protein
MKEIIKYITGRKCPYNDWYQSLSEILQHKVKVRLERVELGNYGDTSNEGGGIIALRFIKDGLRIYIANIDKAIVILLNGGDKSSKAQQNKDIQKAKEYLEEFKSR